MANQLFLEESDKFDKRGLGQWVSVVMRNFNLSRDGAWRWIERALSEEKSHELVESSVKAEREAPQYVINREIQHPNCTRVFSPMIDTGESMTSPADFFDKDEKIGNHFNTNWPTDRPADLSRASWQKKEIVENLSKKAGIDELKANEYIHRWAMSSGDANKDSIAMQMAARDEFNLSPRSLDHLLKLGPKPAQPGGQIWTDSYVQWRAKRDAILGAREQYEEYGEQMRKFVRAMYNETQERLVKEGITEVTVHRGIKVPDPVTTGGFPKKLGDKVVADLETSPMSSFSSKASIAQRFTHPGAFVESNHAYVISTRVPADRVLSTARTGFGCLDEFEIVILDTPGTQSVWYNQAKFPKVE